MKSMQQPVGLLNHGNEIHVNSKQLGIVGNSVGGNMAFVTSMLAKNKKVRRSKYKS